MNIARIADRLNRTGYIVLDNPLQDQLTGQLLARCQDEDPTRFQTAQIGRGLHKKQIRTIRGDVISWLNANATEPPLPE